MDSDKIFFENINDLNYVKNYPLFSYIHIEDIIKSMLAKKETINAKILKRLELIKIVIAIEDEEIIELQVINLNSI